MNEKVILGMVEPYVKNASITYDEFDNIFSMLSLKEQYKVLEMLLQHNIELVDEEEPEENASTQELIKNLDFEILYNDNIFSGEISENLQEKNKNDEPLIVRNHISMSNKVLIRLIQDGDMQAKQDLCIKNKGLVDKVVNAYMKMAGNKLEFEDLHSVGMLGMLKAAERFDLASDYEFSTYATWWIRQSVVREIMDNGFTVRIPVHKMEQILKVMRLDANFSEETEYHKRIKKISEESGYTEEIVIECLKLHYQFLQTVSLNAPVGEDEDSFLEDTIPSCNEMSVEDSVVMYALKENLQKAIATLTPREQQILRMRFGLDDGRNRTLEEIGQELGVTRERIRQIEKKSLQKLRHPSRSKKLEDYYD